MIEEVRERSGRALMFWTPEFRHLEHSGTGLAEVYDKVEPYPVSRDYRRSLGFFLIQMQFSGRVMLDPKMMQQMEPANKVMPKAWAIHEPRTTARICISDLTTDVEVYLHSQHKNHVDIASEARDPGGFAARA